MAESNDPPTLCGFPVVKTSGLTGCMSHIVLGTTPRYMVREICTTCEGHGSVTMVYPSGEEEDATCPACHGEACRVRYTDDLPEGEEVNNGQCDDTVP